MKACNAELKNQEKKLELRRLQGLENVRQGFDREQEVYLERILKLEKELATEELRLSGLATIVSAVPGSGTGGAPSHGAGGGELSSVSVKKPVGKRASVVSMSERESASSVETGMTTETTAIPSKVLEDSKSSGGPIDDSSCDLSDKISDSKGGAPASVGSDSVSLAAKVHESVVSETTPAKATSIEKGSGVMSPPATSLTGDSHKLATTEGTAASSSKPEAESGSNSELVQSMTKFMQAQIDMMAAQTRAVAAQNLPPLIQFSGGGKLVGDESFDRWLEHFEELAAVAGWSEKHKKYRLKMHLSKTAFQTYCTLSKESKQS